MTIALRDVRAAPGRRAELLLISFLLMYLEVACIRWFPAHVLYLTFFTNTVLLASFLGMSLGCLAAGRPRHFLTWTPALLLMAMIAAQAFGFERNALESVLRVGNPLAPQVVFFGTEYAAADPTRFVVPIEAIEGFFFLMVALVMIGPGQELGRAFNRFPDRLHAYSLNVLGSLAGLLLFSMCAWLELSPVWWFVPVVLSLGYFLFGPGPVRPVIARWDTLPSLGAILAVAFWTSGNAIHWSPYYRVDYDAGAAKSITVNLIGHQSMVSRDDPKNPAYAYALPHLLHRDTGGQPFGDVLVIGAGSGNDVSRALAWGARHVDAVEIDPVIQRLGARDHPDRPYQDPRVTVHIGDGRNFLRVAPGKYDLIVFALVDSLVLHSGYSNIRLESFMFTNEALADARAHLKPDGMFVMYNVFRRGWIVARLGQALKDTFHAEPVVLTLPFVDRILADASGGFTILIAGDTARLEAAFRTNGGYWLPMGLSPSRDSPNGFSPGERLADRWIHVGPAEVVAPEHLRSATDDWPFLYLRGPMIPLLTIRGMAVMAGLALVLFAFFAPRGADGRRFPRLDGRMFFLGAGFMLVETKAVVHMALLFGSTWVVNSIVFAGLLVMILGANAFVARVRPGRLAPYYIGLVIALTFSLIIPLDSLLGLGRGTQVALAVLLAFSPAFFAGIIFAISFRQSAHPDRDFGANVAGAMAGGLLENSSMLLGFQYLTLVIIALYALSAVRRSPAAPRLPA